MAQQKIMRDINLNDLISIEASAHVWIMAMAGYAECDWQSGPMSIIFQRVQEAIFDPIYLNEKLAENQQQHDMQEGFFGMLTGRSPEVPPNHEEGPQ